MKGNFGFALNLLNCLKKYNNKAPIMLSSSIQLTLAGRFGNSEYGRSKKAGEELFFRYAQVAREGGSLPLCKPDGTQVLNIIVLFRPSAGRLRTMSLSQSMIVQWSWNYSILMIW